VNELTLAIVGLDYPNADRSNRRFELALCRPGDPLELRPEPRNRHDPRAVAVWRSGGGQLGYISAERCGWIGGRLRGGEEASAVFQGAAGAVAYCRVRFGGGAPTLPPSALREAGGDDDFVPDPEAPEWGA